MRKIIVCISCLCLFAVTISAQRQLETKTLNMGGGYSYDVIVPTLNNLIAIANMNVPTFKSTMSHYRYHQDEQYSGSAYSYTNMNIDFFLDNNNGIGVNSVIYDSTAREYLMAGIWLQNSHAYPSTCIQDLCQELAPYYRETKNDARYYTIVRNGHFYGIELAMWQERQITIVRIYKYD